MFQSLTLIVSLAAFFGYINHRFFKLPTSIGLMIMALITAGVMVVIQETHHALFVTVCQVVEDINFKEVLLDVMLSGLLFAGALHTNLRELLTEKKSIISFATFGGTDQYRSNSRTPSILGYSSLIIPSTLFTACCSGL